jgi:uncharacterized protein (DUF2267 family)
VAAELSTEDSHHAYRVLRSFLHALRDQLTVDEAAKLAAQLPIFARGVFYEGWDPSRTPEHARDIESFLTRIAGEAGLAGGREVTASVSARVALPSPGAPAQGARSDRARMLGIQSARD